MIGSFHIAARLIALVCFVCALAACVSAQDVSLPAKDRFHLFLLVGQSNMAGRGELSAPDTTPHPPVLMLDKSGKWVPAIDPMHFDKPAGLQHKGDKVHWRSLEIDLGTGKLPGRWPYHFTLAQIPRPLAWAR